MYGTLSGDQLQSARVYDPTADLKAGLKGNKARPNSAFPAANPVAGQTPAPGGVLLGQRVSSTDRRYVVDGGFANNPNDYRTQFAWTPNDRLSGLGGGALGNIQSKIEPVHYDHHFLSSGSGYEAPRF